MKEAAFVVGLLAVALYFIGYLQKERMKIIIVNATSRLLYIIQYIMLGAFEGAVLDIAGIISSVLAGKKNTSFVKKHIKIIVLFVNLLIVAMGLLLYENVFSLLPLAGVLLHTGAFWIDNARIIRIISFLGSPFWLVYNFVSSAYGSCIGDVLSMISIAISFYRYDIRKGKENDTEKRENA